MSNDNPGGRPDTVYEHLGLRVSREREAVQGSGRKLIRVGDGLLLIPTLIKRLAPLMGAGPWRPTPPRCRCCAFRVTDLFRPPPTPTGRPGCGTWRRPGPRFASRASAAISSRSRPWSSASSVVSGLLSLEQLDRRGCRGGRLAGRGHPHREDRRVDPAPRLLFTARPLDGPWRIGVPPRGALRILTKHIVRNGLERWEVDNPGGTRMHDASMHPATCTLQAE